MANYGLKHRRWNLRSISTAARYARDMVLDTNKSDYASNQEKLNEAISSLEEKISYLENTGKYGSQCSR